MQAVSGARLRDNALAWLASFLEDRSQVVRVGNSYFSPAEVTSGLVQGSCIVPALFTLVIDKLLCLHHRNVAFADDVKFVADVAASAPAEVQGDIDVVANWSKEYNMPLSIDKTVVMHDGRKQPNNDYYLDGYNLSSRDSFSDLGVSRSANDSFSSYCLMTVNKANKLSGAIWRVFHSSDRRLLWPAFQMYVLPGLMYCSKFWNTNIMSDMKSIEAVQRRISKKIGNIIYLPYNSRLQELDVLSLENRGRFADMVFAYRCLHGQLGITAPQVSLFTVSSNTRSDGIRLLQ